MGGPPLSQEVGAMATVPSNTCSGSTTWHHEDGSLRRAPARVGTVRPQGRSIYALPRRDFRKRLNITLTYLGGPEGYWVIEARGWKWKVPGDIALHDVMLWINRAL
jgi:hypothetical protein